jgi:hypothetical protein
MMAPRNAYPACPVEFEGYSSGVGQDDSTGALCAMPCPPSHIAPFAFCAFASASSEALPKSGAPFALSSLLFTLCPLRHAPCALRFTLCFMLFTFYSLLYAPCTMLYALCSMLAIPLGLGNALSRYPTKLHQLKRRVELFCFARGSPIFQ